MKSIEILELVGHTPDRYILDAENVSAPGTRRPKRVWLIAAIITAMVFLMGCAVVYALKMENMKVADAQGDKLVIGPDGVSIVGTESVDQQVLTLAGLKGSAGYRAVLEWYAFKQEYDPEGEILAQLWDTEAIPEFPAAYDGYGLYSQEMKDALDRILEECALKPRGARLGFRTVKNMCAALGVQRIQSTENDVTVHVDSGGCYENGNFYLLLKFDLPADAGTTLDNTSGTLMWNRKDCFSEDMVTIEDTGDWKEWNYVTSSGYRTLIIRSETDSRGWIICDRGEAILALQIEAIKELWSDEGGTVQSEKLYLTDAQMEQIADAVDFGIRPRIATQEDVDNQPQAPNASTQDGYTVELKSILTDGNVAHITLGITAPEGMVISRTTRAGHEQEPYHIRTANYETLTPAEGRPGSGSLDMNPREDGDGLDNTQDFVIEAEMTMPDGGKPFDIGSVWTLRLEDLLHTYYDTERYTTVEELLAEGEWVFRFTIDETHGDQSVIELVTEPIATKAISGYAADGTPAYRDVTIMSFSLHSMSAVAYCEGSFAPELTNNGDKAIFAVMKDGSRVQLYSSGGAVGVQYLKPETPMDLNQVDYVLLADGTKLAGNG